MGYSHQVKSKAKSRGRPDFLIPKSRGRPISSHQSPEDDQFPHIRVQRTTRFPHPKVSRTTYFLIPESRGRLDFLTPKSRGRHISSPQSPEDDQISSPPNQIQGKVSKSTRQDSKSTNPQNGLGGCALKQLTRGASNKLTQDKKSREERLRDPLQKGFVNLCHKQLILVRLSDQW